MRAPLLYQFWGLVFHCCGVPNSQQQWLSSLAPTTAPLSASNNILWLVSMAENCQGIILSRWWILSTANCLIKMKHLHSSISVVIDQEGTLLGRKICLHPSLDPEVGTDTAKENIGLVLLQYPVRKEEIPLSYTYNSFWKTCYDCQYRHCRVYQYQSHSNFGTSIKQLSVKFLDLSFCHHQQINLTKTDNLCIWRQLQEDCWVQQGSPVLCLFGSHWELVGLVGESSVACYNPIIVIKTAPYLSWMRWLIKASQKSLDPIVSLPCSFTSGERSNPQDRFNLSSGSVILGSHGFSIPSSTKLSTFPLNRQRRNPPPILLGSNKDIFAGSRPLHLHSSQLSSTSKLLMVHSWAFRVAKPWDPSDVAKYWNVPVADTYESWVFSRSQNFPATDVPIPLDLPQNSAMKYQYQTEDNLVRSQVQPFSDKIRLQTVPGVDTSGSWIFLPSKIDGAIYSEMNIIHSQIQLAKVPSHGQLEGTPWLQITTSVRFWTHSVPDKVGTEMQIQPNGENIRAQMHHKINRVQHLFKPATYDWHPQDPVIANKIEFGAHAPFISDGSQYSTVASILEPWFQPVLNTAASQKLVEKTDGYWIPSESKSVTDFTTFDIPYSWDQYSGDTVKPGTQLKANRIRHSSHINRIRPLSELETTIAKTQIQKKYTPWLLTHLAADVSGEPLIYSKIHTVKPWFQSEADIVHTSTQAESQAERPFTQPIVNEIRPWLQTENERISSRTQPTAGPKTQSKEGKQKHWTQSEIDTFKYWTESEIEMISPWSLSEASIVRSWFHTDSDKMRPVMQPEFKTVFPWVQHEVDIARPWVQSEADIGQLWFQNETDTVDKMEMWTQPLRHTDVMESKAEMISPWMWSAADTLQSWTQNEDYIPRPWIHLESGNVQFWTQPEIKVLTHLTQTETDKLMLSVQTESLAVSPWAQSEDDEVRLWNQNEIPQINIWTQAVADTVIPWIHAESPVVNQWKENINDVPWTLAESQTVNIWTQAVADTVIPWSQTYSLIIMPWTQPESDTVVLWTEVEIPVVNPCPQFLTKTVTLWTQAKSSTSATDLKTDTVRLWTQDDSEVINTWAELIPYISTSWNQTESPAVKFWTESEGVTLWSQSEFSVVNSWTQLVADTVTLCTQADSAEINARAQNTADTVTEWTQVGCPVVNSWTQTKASIITPWTQVDSLAANLSIEAETDKIIQWTQTDSPAMLSWAQPEAIRGRLLKEAETSTVNPWTQTVPNTYISWTQPESTEINSWIKAVDGTTTPQTEAETPSQMPWEQIEADTLMLWTEDKIPRVSLWSQTDNIATLWTKAESPAVSRWTQTVADRVTVWTQADSLAIHPWTETESDIDAFATWIQDDSLASKLWTQTVIDTVTPWAQVNTLPVEMQKQPITGSTQWTQADSLAVNPGTDIIVYSPTPWAQFISPAVSLWEYPVTAKVIQWTKAEFPATNLWIQAISKIITPWNKAEIPVVYLSAQLNSSSLTPWIKAGTPILNHWVHTETITVTVSIQAKSLTMKPWTQAVANTVTLWISAETPELNVWAQPKADTVSVEAESAIVHTWKQPVTGRVLPWSQPESAVLKPWKQLVTGRITLWTQTDSIALNSWEETEVDTGTPWTSDESPFINNWVQDVVATIRLLTLAELPIVNSWKWAVTDKVTQWTQSAFPTVNPWVEDIANKVTLWTPTGTATINPQKQSIVERVALQTEVESPVVNFGADDRANVVTLLTLAESSAVNLWTQAVNGIIVTLWNQAKSPSVKPWKQSENETVTPWIHVKSPVLNPRNQPIQPETFTLWTLVESLTVNFWTQAVTGTVMPWTHSDSLAVNLWTKIIADKVIPWTWSETPSVKPWVYPESDTIWALHKPKSKKPLTLLEADMFQLSLRFQTATTWSSIQFESQTLLPWIHPAVDIVNSWAVPETGKIPVTQAERLWLNPKAAMSRSWSQTQTDTVQLWMQPESQILITLTQSETERVGHIARLEADTVVSWMPPETGIVHFWIKPEGDTWKSLTHSEVVTLATRIETEVSTVIPWAQPKTNIIRPWTQADSQTVSSWTKPEADTDTLLTQPIMQVMTPLTLHEINTVRPWFQTQTDTIKQGIQSEFQIGMNWTHPEWQMLPPWNQTETVRDRSDGDVAQLWTFTLTSSEVDTLELFTQHESQTTGLWTEAETDTLWYHTQNDAVRSWFQPESQLVQSWIQSEVGITYPGSQDKAASVRLWIKPEISTVRPWTHLDAAIVTPWIQPESLEVYPWTQPKSDTVRKHWFHTQINSERHWTQAERKAIETWAQPERQMIIPSTSFESEIVRPWFQSQSDTRPWFQSESQIVSRLTQTDVSLVLFWTWQAAATITPWVQPETQKIKPWLRPESESIRYRLQIQMNKVRPLALPESQMFSPWTQSEIAVVHIWNQTAAQTGRPLIHDETYVVTSWTQVGSQVLKSWSLSDKVSTFISWFLPVNPAEVLWTQPKEISLSFAVSKPDEIKTSIQPETKILSPGNHSKTVRIESYPPPKVKLEGANLLNGQFGSWYALVPVETVPSPEQSYITLSIKIAPTENQDRMRALRPSDLTSFFLLTHSSAWLPRRVSYQNLDSILQMTEGRSPSVPSITVSSFSSFFSFLTPCSLSSSCILPPLCSTLSPCPFFSLCILPSCPIRTTAALFTPVLLPLISFSNSLQDLYSSKFNEEVILPHTLSSFYAPPAAFLTKQPFLMPGSQSVPRPKYQPEQEPLKYSELNVSLAECHLGVVWKESLQALWLFKTAVIVHESTDCGLRPGLVPHCPNCWEAEVGEFPWMVSVQLSFSHFCAGSILNEQWILTTARCANFIKNSEALALVQVGLIDLQDSVQAQTVGIHRAMPYLGPQGPLGPGLIFLKQPLHFQPLVLPICLEDSLEQKNNIQLYDCWLPSWSLMRGSPGILQKRHLSILKVSTCAQFWPKLNEFTFCVEAKKAMGEAGCKGDLGAPLVCRLQQQDTWVQVGILSHFDEHCTKPYVFSQVSPFLFWLQGVTRPSHVPWSQQGLIAASGAMSSSVSVSTNASALTSAPASVRPHFTSLPQPQTLADRISLRYAMPWQAMIISCGSQICSGSIISNSWVLTAAHCVRNMNPKDTAVILGLRHTGAPLRVVKVSTILPHERFRLVNGAARNDLALVLLQEVQTPIQLLAPLGHLKNLNSSECWLSGPLILKPGETDENPEMLQMQVKRASSCAHLYPDIGTSIICFITQATETGRNVELVSPGSAVMCRPVSGKGRWRQIGLTSLKALATIVSPHFSWILSTSAKAGHPLNQALMPWVEKPKSSSLLKQPPTLPLSSIMIIAVQSLL